MEEWIEPLCDQVHPCMSASLPTVCFEEGSGSEHALFASWL